ncbi:MAG: winged helix-turn-helix domain-containing protein [Arenicella sp.]|nr:winged helix-turn-helix domain-containing protein [Arenicella sp.]
MPLLKFEDFVFDSTSHRLTRNGAKVAMRPKALKLLCLLINNRHRVVPKPEIISTVWGSDYARDHLLFQLIGELRKPPLKSEFVRTVPNEGYQWSIATKVVYNRISFPKLIAASVITTVVGLSILLSTTLNKADSRSQTAHLPAYRALSKGIVALENGDKDEAIEWFKFALVENPDSVESSLFLAETLYQQNRPKESSDRLQHVLQKGSLSAYNKATATNILSRISEQQGQLDDALRYAQNSLPTGAIGQCSVDFVEQRIERLESGLAMSPNPSNRNDTKLKHATPLSESYIDQCQQLNNRDAQSSSCQAIENQAVVFSRSITTAIEKTA